MNNKKKRWRKKRAKNKRCQYIAELNGYCRFHQNEPISLEFWQNQEEDKRLHYLQICAEMRALKACENTKDNKEADMRFSRNLRMVAVISRLRHSLHTAENTKESHKANEWLSLLESDASI